MASGADTAGGESAPGNLRGGRPRSAVVDGSSTDDEVVLVGVRRRGGHCDGHGQLVVSDDGGAGPAREAPLRSPPGVAQVSGATPRRRRRGARPAAAGGDAADALDGVSSPFGPDLAAARSASLICAAVADTVAAGKGSLGGGTVSGRPGSRSLVAMATADPWGVASCARMPPRRAASPHLPRHPLSPSSSDEEDGVGGGGRGPLLRWAAGATPDAAAVAGALTTLGAAGVPAAPTGGAIRPPLPPLSLAAALATATAATRAAPSVAAAVAAAPHLPAALGRVAVGDAAWGSRGGGESPTMGALAHPTTASALVAAALAYVQPTAPEVPATAAGGVAPALADAGVADRAAGWVCRLVAVLVRPPAPPLAGGAAGVLPLALASVAPVASAGADGETPTPAATAWVATVGEAGLAAAACHLAASVRASDGFGLPAPPPLPRVYDCQLQL